MKKVALTTLSLMLIGVIGVIWPSGQAFAAHGFAQCTAQNWIDSGDAYVWVASSNRVPNEIDQMQVRASHGHKVMGLRVQYGNGAWRTISIPQSRQQVNTSIPRVRVTQNSIVNARVTLSLMGPDRACTTRVPIDLY